MKIFIPAFALAALALPLWPQGPSADRINVPLADPSRPARLIISCLNGRVTVHGTDSQEIGVLTRGGEKRHTDRPDGLRRIDTGLSGLNIDQSGNVVTIGTSAAMNNADLTLQVPLATSLKMKSVMGDLDIDNVAGDIEAGSTNGRIRLTNISGAAVIHGLNGSIVATFTHVPADKSMSFSSLNGDIDVTLPADTHARLKVRTNNGETYSDFDIHLEPGPVSGDTHDAGHRRITIEHGITGTINGGGPEIQFVTFNGNIRIRKGK